MHVLTIDIGSYTHADFLMNLRKMGHTYKNVFYDYKTNDWELKYHNDEFEKLITDELSDYYDCVVTTNFYPIVARVCYKKNIKYIAWSYDSPINLPSTDEMDYTTNYVFLFDKAEAQKYKDKGFDNFFHLPLAVDCDRLDSYSKNDLYKSDVSFMGQLYESTLPGLKAIMKPYQRELIDKIVQTQLKVYGNWFVDDMLTDSIIGDINAHYHSLSEDAIQISRPQLSYSIAQHITHIERITLLCALQKRGYKVDLYTYPLSDTEKDLLKDINVHGKINYFNEMPMLFKSSTINLNPTLKNISSGISLRALDIMGCGGFLLSNFQPELNEYFEDGNEVVMYRSMEEAIEKTIFYMKHDDERNKISKRGYEKVKRDFNYSSRIKEMFRVAGLI